MDTYLRLHQTEQTCIRLYSKDDGGWDWHVELWFKEGVHPYTDEGKARWKWLARKRAEKKLRELRKK